jgi:hypothetical protein
MPQQKQKPDDGIIDINGKPYTKVWKRCEDFIEDIGFKTLIKDKELTSLKRETTIVEENDEFLHMLCTLSVQFGDTDISVEGNARNWKTNTYKDAKLIEKCESIAFGRALSVLGYGGEIATAEEMDTIDEDGKQIEKNHALKEAKKAEEVKKQQQGFEARDSAVSFGLTSEIQTAKKRLLELKMSDEALTKLWLDEFGERMRMIDLNAEDLKKFLGILKTSIKELEVKPEEEAAV